MESALLIEFKDLLSKEPKIRHPDKHTRKLLRYLFTSTRGGFTRLRIIMLLTQNSYNAHKLSKELGLDYKAVQHHLKVLEKNNLISKIGDKYGALYRLSNFLEANIRALDEVLEELDKKINYKKVYL